MSEYVATLLLLQNKKWIWKRPLNYPQLFHDVFRVSVNLQSKYWFSLVTHAKHLLRPRKMAMLKAEKKNFSDTNTNQMFFLDKNRTM